ncbi:MAG: hypothetical protein IMX03_08065 [Brockia lithotrophica]|nr:hypothetical protein [Brockia lithotrophica]
MSSRKGRVLLSMIVAVGFLAAYTVVPKTVLGLDAQTAQLEEAKSEFTTIQSTNDQSMSAEELEKYLEQLDENERAELEKQAFDEAKDELKQEIKQELKIEIKEELKNELKEELKKELKDELRNELRDEIKKELTEELLK